MPCGGGQRNGGHHPLRVAGAPFQHLHAADGTAHHGKDLFDADFQVESYLRYQGKKFVDRFDANSFLYITKAADYFDLRKQYGNGSSVEAFSKTKAKFLVVSYTSDWLYPTYQSRSMVKAMKKNGLDVSFCEIEAEWGHDAFLLPNPTLNSMVKGFLERVYHEAK